MGPPYALSAQDQQALAAELAKPAYAGLTDAQIFDAVNNPTPVPNPDPAPRVPKPFAVSDVFGLISPASLGRLVTVPYLPDVRDQIAANNRAGCALYAQLFLGTALLTQAEHDAIAAVLTATIPDPAWPATVPGPSVKATLFGDKSWTATLPPGGRVDAVTYNFVPAQDIAAITGA